MTYATQFNSLHFKTFLADKFYKHNLFVDPQQYLVACFKSRIILNSAYSKYRIQLSYTANLGNRWLLKWTVRDERHTLFSQMLLYRFTVFWILHFSSLYLKTGINSCRVPTSESHLWKCIPFTNTDTLLWSASRWSALFTLPCWFSSQ